MRSVKERLPAMLRAGGPARETASQGLRDLLARAALAYLVRQRYPAEAFGSDNYDAVAGEMQMGDEQHLADQPC